MDQLIEDRLNDSVVAEVAQRYGVEPAGLQPIAASESFIYAFQQGPNKLILRLSHSIRRNKALILGELDWLNYLAAAGISVAGGVASPAGNLIETVPDGQGGQFLATAFTRAIGQSPYNYGWNKTLYWEYGNLLGRIHAHSKLYTPAPGCYRPQWDHDSLDLVEQYLPASESLALEHYRALHQERQQLTQDPDGYGLIHQDAHGGNFLVDPTGAITLFDFDDCIYSWFSNDIAMAIFYRVLGEEEPAQVAAEFLTPFLAGYAAANRLKRQWLGKIPLFLKAREIELFALMYREHGGLDDIDDGWDQLFMAGRKENIDGNHPFIEFDFDSFGDLT